MFGKEGSNWIEVAKLAQREQTLQKRAEEKILQWAELSEELSATGATADDGDQ